MHSGLQVTREDSPRQRTSARRIRVFLSYRQGEDEGSPIARSLFQHLHGDRIRLEDGTEYVFDFYWDKLAPAVHDFQAHLLPRLRASKAFILICTPGSAERRQGVDYLFNEIEWWLQNRETGPILILRSAEELASIPAQIIDQYPRAQRLEWSDENVDTILARIRDGIFIAENGVSYEELLQLRLRNRLLAGALLALSIVAVLLVVSLKEARESRAAAQAQLRNATRLGAREAIAEGRVSEGVALIGSLGVEEIEKDEELSLVIRGVVVSP